MVFICSHALKIRTVIVLRFGKRLELLGIGILLKHTQFVPISKATFFLRGVADKSLARLLSVFVGRNRLCRWKEGSVHVPNCKSFLVREAEMKHVRRRARFQQHRDASCHKVFSCKARRWRKFMPFWQKH